MSLGRRWREGGVKPVTSRPEWLTTAREHLHRHVPGEGLAESCLWALHALGFDPLAPTRRARASLEPMNEEDILEQLRKVTT